MKPIGTGYFATPAKPFHWSKVHYVSMGIPLCGTKFRDDMKYQWCAMRPHINYLECKNCARAYIKLLNEEIAIQSSQIIKEIKQHREVYTDETTKSK